MILCMISYVMSCHERDCVVILDPYPNNPNPVESFNLKTYFYLTGDGLVWYSSSTAPCVGQASRRLCTVVSTRRCPWCISALT